MGRSGILDLSTTQPKGGIIPLRLRSFLTQQRRSRDMPPFGFCAPRRGWPPRRGSCASECAATTHFGLGRRINTPAARRVRGAADSKVVMTDRRGEVLTLFDLPTALGQPHQVDQGLSSSQRRSGSLRGLGCGGAACGHHPLWPRKALNTPAARRVRGAVDSKVVATDRRGGVLTLFDLPTALGQPHQVDQGLSSSQRRSGSRGAWDVEGLRAATTHFGRGKPSTRPLHGVSGAPWIQRW